jgi:hypothetical protein
VSSTAHKSTSDFEFGPAQHVYLNARRFVGKDSRDEKIIFLDSCEMMYAGSFFIITIFYHFDAGFSEDLTLSHANNISLL